MEWDISSLKWTVSGYHPYIPIQGQSMETSTPHVSLTGELPASVPGGVHFDLYNAGMLPPPYENQNSLACEWVEHRWWVYRVEIPMPKERYDRLELCFKGIDYEAVFYIDTLLKGEHKGMYTPFKLDLTEYQGKESVALEVIFKGVPQEMGQVGDTFLTSTQKSRFNYKWDFGTRLVNIGLWQEVVLKGVNGCQIQDVYLKTDYQQGEGIIDLSLNLSAAKGFSCFENAYVEARVLEGETVAAKVQLLPNSLGCVQGQMVLLNPRLWWPNGHGEAFLYRVEIKVFWDNELIEVKTMKTGIRSLAYGKNEGSPKDALPYTFIINGKRIYIKGVNMTPLDHMYGGVNAAQYRQMLHTIKHMNVNMIRIWGGGLIEKEAFYDLCDEMGLLIWQEFIQSSSGIGNEPAKEPAFLVLLKDNAEAALYEKRSHVALSVWSGGNELMKTENRPVDYSDSNIAMLQKLVKQIDPQRLFLPTSASGPREFLDLDERGVSHDVHGSWQYGGNPRHYHIYNHSDSLFHSEFGADGLSCMKSLRKFVEQKHLTPKRMNDDNMWKFHGQWWGTYNRDMEILGALPDMETFVHISQWMQAEALRYALEANLRRKFNNSGSIIWQMNEPWPNISCTNLVDYYGECKMAYYWARKAYAPVSVSLRYDRLDYEMGKTQALTVYANNCQGQSFGGLVTITIYNMQGQTLYEGELPGVLEENGVKALGKLCFTPNEGYRGLFAVRLELRGNDGALAAENTYYFSTQGAYPYGPMLELDKAQLEWELTARQGDCLTFRVKNTGAAAALHVYAQEKSDCYIILADGMYESLFPGQEREIAITCRKRLPSGFSRLADPGPLEEPEIAFFAMN